MRRDAGEAYVVLCAAYRSLRIDSGSYGETQLVRRDVSQSNPRLKAAGRVAVQLRNLAHDGDRDYMQAACFLWT